MIGLRATEQLPSRAVIAAGVGTYIRHWVALLPVGWRGGQLKVRRGLWVFGKFLRAGPAGRYLPRCGE